MTNTTPPPLRDYPPTGAGALAYALDCWGYWDAVGSEPLRRTAEGAVAHARRDCFEGIVRLLSGNSPRDLLRDPAASNWILGKLGGARSRELEAALRGQVGGAA